jgi:hypothetical protein
MRKRILIFVIVLCCAALFPLPSQSHMDGSQRINGTVISISGRSAGRSSQFSLIINRYTAPNQLRELNEALSRGGQDDLVKALSKMDAGRIQFGGGVGVPANAIIPDHWGDGGTKLTVLYERYIRFFELRYGTRSQDYPVGYAEIFLDRNGHGEGTLIPAAKVRLKGENTWEVEDFGVLPARLMGLRSSGNVEIR